MAASRIQLRYDLHASSWFVIGKLAHDNIVGLPCAVRHGTAQGLQTSTLRSLQANYNNGGGEVGNRAFSTSRELCAVSSVREQESGRPAGQNRLQDNALSIQSSSGTVFLFLMLNDRPGLFD